MLVQTAFMYVNSKFICTNAMDAAAMFCTQRKLQRPQESAQAPTSNWSCSRFYYLENLPATLRCAVKVCLGAGLTCTIKVCCINQFPICSHKCISVGARGRGKPALGCLGLNSVSGCFAVWWLGEGGGGVSDCLWVGIMQTFGAVNASCSHWKFDSNATGLKPPLQTPQPTPLQANRRW